MMIHRTAAGYLVLVVGCAVAPMIPFLFLWIIPVGAVLFGVHVPALIVAVLFDAFLVPPGAPFWISQTFLTLCFLPAYLLLRHLVKL